MNESCRYSAIKIEITAGSLTACPPTAQGVYVSSPLSVLFLCQFQILAESNRSCAHIKWKHAKHVKTYESKVKTECLQDSNTHKKL